MDRRRKGKPAKSGESGGLKKRPRVRDLVAEGLYIASAATRLKLKNRILVETISGGDNFSVEHFVDEARATLLELADEAEAEGARIKRDGRGAWRRFDESSGTHDYGSKDVRNLKRRRKQSAYTAKALRERAEDEAGLRELVEAARDAAWGEVARNIDRSLRIEAARPDLEEDYERMRGARMQALKMVDLSSLRQQQRRRERIAKHGIESLIGADSGATSTGGAGAGAGAGAKSKRPKKDRPFVPGAEGDLHAHARARGIDVGELE